MQLILPFLCVILFSLSANAADFRVRLSAAPKTLDWNSATSGSEGAILQNLMEGLFGFDSKWNLTPALAESYRWSSDAKTLEITLKKKVRWQDGTPLKASQLVDGFERLLNPNLNSANASMLFDVMGAREYYFGKTKNFSEVGISAPKDDVLKIILKEPRANFLNVLTHWATFPYRKDKPAQTLGAYQLVQKQANEIRLKSNPLYYGKPAQMKSVDFQVIPEGAEALKAFQTKKIDYLLQLEDEIFEKNKTLPGLGFVDPIRVVALLHFNPSRVLTNSPEKRRKIMAAISTESLIAANAETRVPAPSIIPFPLQKMNRFVPEKSNASLPDEGLTLGYPNDALSKSIAERMQATSKTIKLKIETLPQNDQAAAKRYDLILTLFGLDYFDPDQLFSSFLSQGTNDLFNLSSAEFLQLIQKARATPNSKDRAKVYLDAADYLQNRLAVVMPLFYRRRAFLLNPRYRAEAGSQGTPLITRIHLSK
jgi:oligopeptide transport system substrate-binding protein